MPLKYVLYARKSSESEDKQKASIEDQVAECISHAKKNGYEIVDTICEAISAKKPGRLGFASMMKKLERRKVEGIICWKLDRLARNPIDGGHISWYLQQGKIKHIATVGKDYYPKDNVLMMQVEFGMANQYINDLSDNVLRGYRRKAERGWYPYLHLPLGYRHNTGYKLGSDAEIIPKEGEFKKVKKLWNIFLSENFQLDQILDVAIEMRLLKASTKAINRKRLLRIFRNPFYSGKFFFTDSNEVRKLHEGKHKTMISQKDYRNAQKILDGDSRSTRAKKYNFPYRGLITCGECKGHITSEHKYQIICTACKKKFSAKTKDFCPLCNRNVSEMANPSTVDITYYRCTKNHEPCSQSAITVKEIENQIQHELTSIRYNNAFRTFVLKGLEEIEEIEGKENIVEIKKAKYKIQILKQRQERLIELRSDDELTKEEYLEAKNRIDFELSKLEQNTKNHSFRLWKDLLETDLDFLTRACTLFINGDKKQKKEVLQRYASNLELLDKNLSFTRRNGVDAILKCFHSYKAKKGCFEPKKRYAKQGYLDGFALQLNSMRADLTTIRTQYRTMRKKHLLEKEERESYPYDRDLL